MKKKLIVQTELWVQVKQLLDLTRNNVNTKYCRSEITSHPDYPALSSATDFLETGGFKYRAVQADISHINEFKYPLLAHITKPGQTFLYLIRSNVDWEEEVVKHWSGVVLFPEEKARWSNRENDKHLLTQSWNNKIAIALYILGLLFLGLSVSRSFHLNTAIFGFLSLLGTAISIMLISAEIGMENAFVKQVCGTVNPKGCNSVLKSKYAKASWGSKCNRYFLFLF